MTEPQPTPTPAPKPIVNPAGSLEQRIALAKSKSDAPAKPAATEPELATEPEATEDAAAEPADGAEEAEAADADEGEDTEEAPLGTPEERLAAVNTALEKGDIDALVKAIGGDPAKVNAPTKKRFRALARELGKIQNSQKKLDTSRDKAKEELSAESNRLSVYSRSLAQKYGAADESLRAWDAGDYTTVSKALERHFKTDIITITQNLASGKTSKTDEEKALDAKRAEIERRERELKEKEVKTDSEKTAAQKREAAIERTGKILEGHPYLAAADGKPDPEALAEVFAAYEKTWDGKRFTKSAKQVADELQKKLEAKAAARGLVKKDAAPAGKTTPKPAPRRPAAARLPEPPRSVQRKDLGTRQHLEETREDRIARTKRLMEMSTRGVR